MSRGAAASQGRPILFTGIVRGTGVIRGARDTPAGRRLVLEVGAIGRPARGDSVCVSGVCLTVATEKDGLAVFDVVPETISKTTLGDLGKGDRVNLEPALRAGDPLSGHLVMGHVDAVGKVLRLDRDEGIVARVKIPRPLAKLVAPKGSVALDGVSLTVVSSGVDWLSVALIPTTLDLTTARDWKEGTPVNVEADVLARYVAKVLGKRT
ncbi:MAG: riboflavin synthase [Planctomycetales bacterium]|nr:riboflavin synthase [Planctomycetales bacterium]